MAEELAAQAVASEPDPSTPKKREADGEAGLLGIALAFVYGTGLATSNMFLGRFGISDFSVIRPRAIFAGAIVLGAIALLSAGPMDLIARYIDELGARRTPFGELVKNHAWIPLYEREEGKKHSHFMVVMKALLPWLAVVLLCWLVIHKNGQDNQSFSFPDIWYEKVIFSTIGKVVWTSVGLYVAASVTTTLAIQSLRKYRNIHGVTSFAGIANRLAKISLYVAGSFAGLGTFISIFSWMFYPVIPTAIGGPGIHEMQFELKQGADQLAKLGMPFTPKNERLTQSLQVIYESDDFVYVSFISNERKPNLDSNVEENIIYTKVLRIDKKIILGSVVVGTDPIPDDWSIVQSPLR